MQISIHLSFSGQCQEAFEFYAELFDGSLSLFTYGKSPLSENVPKSWYGKISHANLKIKDMEIAGIDLLPELFQQPQGFSILLEVDTKQEVERLFAQLSEDAEVKMEPQKTFWSPCYCILTDRFGTPWEIYSETKSN